MLRIMINGQVSLHDWCFVGKEWGRKAAFSTAPTRCLRVWGKKDERASTVALLFGKRPPVLGRGARKGQRKGKQRAGPVNNSNVRKEEKESGDRARGKGVGAQACKADSPTCRSVFQQRSWPWSQ